MSSRVATIMSHIAPSDTAGSSSLFDHVSQAPDDPILGLDIAFKNDQHPDKLNLGVGAYRTSDGKPYLLHVVQKV
jgi:aspartate aminotransferase, cytoplasmic